MDEIKWLEERRKGVGGSDVAAILGLSPWKTPYQVFLEKTSPVILGKQSKEMDWGKRMEPAIRQWYSDETGRSVRLPEGVIFNEKYPHMLASIDGFTDDKRVVEIKTSRSRKGWGEPATNEIPDYYLLQCQHYLVVTAYEVADVPVSISGDAPCLYEIPADKELQQMIIDACTDFWQRVVENNPPPPVTYEDIIMRYGKSKAAGKIEASPELVGICHKLIDIQYDLKQLEGVEAEAKGKIIEYLGDLGDTLISGDTVLATYKMTKGREIFDTKSFKVDHPELYEKYAKQTEAYRRFLIK